VSSVDPDVIDVRNLRKEYGGFVAVEDSTFSVEEGEVFGIIGPNGAGKTTTLKAIAGLLEPTAGTVEVDGQSADSRDTRRLLGFLPEESPLYEEMTALSYLRFFADLYDVPRDVANARIHDALDRLELDHRERAIGDMSKGMKRKVAIARSLVNDPDVLIYDEPASGLDPLTTNYVIDFTKELAAEGRTVVFSAHNLYHVEEVCDRVAIMNEGRIVTQGPLAELREQYGTTEYHVFTTVDVPDAVAENGRYRRVVETMDGVEEIRKIAQEKGGSIDDIRTVEPTLEGLFLDLAESGGRKRDSEPTEA
jgi:ABC-2 type transport system ATP-binding protein